MDAETGRFINGAVNRIMAAGRRGAISPNSARSWAVEIADQRAHPDTLDELAVPPGDLGERNRAVWAAQAGDVLSDVMTTPTRLLGQETEPTPEGWQRIFPDLAARAERRNSGPMPAIYSREVGTPEPPSPVSWDNYINASAGTDDYADDDMTDTDAAQLSPPKTWREAEARHRAREVRAGAMLDYDDEELYAMLFGWPDD